MRFPSIREFKKRMGGRKGFVILLSNPKGENVHDMIVEGRISDEQFDFLEKLVIDILKENARTHKSGDPVSYKMKESE